MKYYIIAGEASGDLHGSNLMKALFKEDNQADIRFWGGDLMSQVGGTLVKHYKERAFMGFIEVLMNLRKILGLIRFCKKDISKFQPDTLIFIDNSGFNLRIATWGKQHGYKTNYYISPQVWASRSGRVEKIKKVIDHMYVILPFEKKFYKKYDYDVTFVGHPLIDAISNRTQVDEVMFRKEYRLGDKPIIALLPGSRKQEITKMLSVMLSLIEDYPDYQFVIAGAPSQNRVFYEATIGSKDVAFIDNRTYDLLSISFAAVVTSGTATLETALFKVPQVVCYKGSTISYLIAKSIITLRYISLVNLIMDSEVVKELIQYDVTKKNVSRELDQLLDKKYRTNLFEKYYQLELILGGKGASENAAKLIVASL